MPCGTLMRSFCIAQQRRWCTHIDTMRLQFIRSQLGFSVSVVRRRFIWVGLSLSGGPINLKEFWFAIRSWRPLCLFSRWVPHAVDNLPSYDMLLWWSLDGWLWLVLYRVLLASVCLMRPNPESWMYGLHLIYNMIRVLQFLLFSFSPFHMELDTWLGRPQYYAASSYF